MKYVRTFSYPYDLRHYLTPWTFLPINIMTRTSFVQPHAIHSENPRYDRGERTTSARARTAAVQAAESISVQSSSRIWRQLAACETHVHIRRHLRGAHAHRCRGGRRLLTQPPRRLIYCGCKSIRMYLAITYIRGSWLFTSYHEKHMCVLQHILQIYAHSSQGLGKAPVEHQASPEKHQSSTSRKPVKLGKAPRVHVLNSSYVRTYVHTYVM